MFKVAIIGAGSIGFTREIVKDLLCVPEFKHIELSLMDINEKNLDMAEQLLVKDFQANGITISIHKTTDRLEALRGAKYIMNFTRIGMLEAFAHDVDIPMAYGVDQCVGDTLGPGGIMYGQRGIPAVLDFCRDIKAVALPGCIMLNYANPNAMLTWAANHYGGVDTVGLCHGVQNGHKLIGEAFELDWKDIDIVCVGINHQTFYTSITYKGKELKDELLERLLNHPKFSKEEKVRIDVLKHFGYFSTESNGHLSEYLPWYRKRPEDIKNWIDLDRWILGESGGYLRHCTERRNWFETEFPEWLEGNAYVYSKEHQGVEHGAHIIEALETGRIYRGHFNVVNKGVITNLPSDAIVEVPAYVDRTGIQVPVYGDLPLGCAAICQSSIQVQRLSVEAAVKGDITLLRQAMMMDPLTAAVLDTYEIVQMTDDLLIALENWLPQYTKAIGEAKERRMNEERLPLKNYTSATRLKVKTMDELKSDIATTGRFNKAAHQN
jgi:alpha-galactosidase